MAQEMEDKLEQAARWLDEARRPIALTGAGISTESGIPDFRSAEGLWSRYNPAEFATLGAFLRDPAKVWRMLAELEHLLDARPNPGHLALAELERADRLAGVVTQNVDGLHEAAGNARVVEFHGSHRTFSCLACGAVYDQEAVRPLPRPPRCPRELDGRRCGAILKPDVVFFDEMIPPRAQEGAAELVAGADLILVVGTSCEVYPVADIPFQVQRQGGRVVEINKRPAEDLPADIVLQGRSATLLPALVERWRALEGRG